MVQIFTKIFQYNSFLEGGNTHTDILMFYHIQQENNDVQAETSFDQFV